MSLTTFVRSPQVRERLTPILKTLLRPAKVPILVVPRPGDALRASRVGTAYDYLLRFELGRRMPHAIETPWVATEAVAQMPQEVLSADGSHFPWQTAYRAFKECESIVTRYRRDPAPVASSLRECARASLVLARLDGFFRGGYDGRRPVEQFLDVPADEVEEVDELLGATPLHRFQTQEVVLLNPAFGRHSQAVLGADADLVMDGQLIDIKTVRECSVGIQDLRQLLGYLLLARAMREDDPRFPEITTLAIFLARFGLVWTVEANQIIADERFGALEAWWRATLSAEALPVAPMVGSSIAAGAGVPRVHLREPRIDLLTMLSLQETLGVLASRSVAVSSPRETGGRRPLPRHDWGKLRTNLTARLSRLRPGRSLARGIDVELPGLPEPVCVTRLKRGVFILRMRHARSDASFRDNLRVYGGRMIYRLLGGFALVRDGWQLRAEMRPAQVADVALALAESFGAQPSGAPAAKVAAASHKGKRRERGGAHRRILGRGDR